MFADSTGARQRAGALWLSIGKRKCLWIPRNRMREIFTSGSVGEAVGDNRFYPARINEGINEIDPKKPLMIWFNLL